MRSLLRLLGLALGGLVFGFTLPAGLSAQSCSTSWINPSGGNWATAANWSSGLPNAGSNACINLPGTYTVTLSSSATVTSLTLGTASGAGVQTLALSSNLTLSAASLIEATGALDWQSGAISGGGGGLTSKGTLAIGSGGHDLRGVLTNEATATLGGPVQLVNGARLVNAAGGTMTFTGDDNVTQFNASTLVNDGTLVKDGTAGETGINSGFANTGTVEVRTGTLRLSGGSTLGGGTYTARADAALVFDSHTYVTGTLAGSPAGTVSLVNGTFFADGVEAVLAFGGTGFQWHSGAFNQRSGGAWRNDGLLEITNSNSHDLYGRLTNAATARATANVRLLNGAELVNAATGTLTFDGALSVTQFNNSTLANDGTFVKTGAGVATVSSLFANTSAIDVQAGTLRLSGPRVTLTGGTYAVADAATLAFNANTYATGTLTGAPAGTLVMEGGTFHADGGETVLAFTGTGFEWRDGTFRGANGGTWRNDARVVLATAAGKDVYDTFTNAATLTLGGPVRLLNGARLVNAASGTMTFTGDDNVTQFNPSRLVNHGTLVKDGASGTTAIGSEFENTGAVGVETGVLRLDGGIVLGGGTYAVAAAATLQFNSNTHVTGTLSGSPAGLVAFTGATFYADGADARLAFGGAGAEWHSGAFRSTNGGTWFNDGTLALATGGGKDIFDTFTNTATLTLAGPLRLLNGARLVNDADGEMRVEGNHTISQFNPATFVNAGRLVVSGDTLTVNSGFQHRATGTISGDGRLALSPAPMHGTVAPGLLAWTRPFSMDSTSARLDVEIGGANVGTGYSRLAVQNTAALQGTLRARLTNGFAPQPGAEFAVLTATSLTGGFDQLEGLTDAGANVSLYPAIADTAVVLTARAGVPTASGALTLIPASTTNGTVVTLLLSGTGFAPDATVTLECDDCSAPQQFATVAGRIHTMTPTTARVVFDLTNPFIAGTYDVVLEDPRGGRVTAPLAIGAGAGNLAIRAFAQGTQASERGPTPGVIQIEMSAPQATPTVVTYSVGGTATLFQDYVLSSRSNSITIPAGHVRAAINVLPLPDAAQDDGETVEITLDASSAYKILGSATFTVTIEDGPAPTDFALYASSPRRAGNGGTVIFNVTGQAIGTGATARLSGPGVNLTASVVNVNDGGNFMNAMFDLTGVAAGTTLDLTVTSGSGSETLAGAVLVEALVKPEIAVTLVGPNTFRSFLPPQRYQVMVTNRGNVDVMAVPVSIAVSKAGNGFLAPDFDVTFLDPAVFGNAPDGFPGWDRSKLIEDRGDGRLVMSLIVPAVRAGETVTLSVMARGYRIKAWTSPSARPIVPNRPVIRMRSRGLAASEMGALGNVWVGMDTEALTMQLAQAVDPDGLRNCLLTFAGSVLGATPLGCGAEVARSITGFVGAMAGIASTPNAGIRDGAVATVSMVGSMAAIIAECAFKSSPWGLGIGVAVGAISTINSCIDLFGEPEGDGQDNDDIRASDPNDKLGPSGVGTERYAAGIDAAGYLIRFENDTTATAPAILVNVTDPLDTQVYDLSTFALGTIAFGDTSVTPPPGLQQWSTTVTLPGETRFEVRILAGLNPETGVVTWQMEAIDPATGQYPSDATAGFLPPNVNKGEGEGSLFFTIHPKKGLPSGTKICNAADIVFDVNDAIATPPWCNTLDYADPTSSLAALDAVQTDSTFTVAWTGSDETSGVAEYLVYVSTNGGPFALWEVTGENALPFPGRQDSTYAFYVVARDGAGNLEDKEEMAEATTTVDVTIVGVEDENLPTAFALEPNAPNPFRDATRLRYALPEPSAVRIEVFDALGRRVAVLADETQPAGWYAVDWDAAASLSSGLYFIRLQAGRFVEVRQATLVR